MVYTKKLAKALVNGLVDTLQFLGDMRWSMVPSNSFAWTCGLDVGSDVEHELWPTMWSSTSPQTFTIFYVDIVRDEEAWRPIMQEVKVRLQDRVATSAIVKPSTGFFEQIPALVLDHSPSSDSEKSQSEKDTIQPTSQSACDPSSRHHGNQRWSLDF